MPVDIAKNTGLLTCDMQVLAVDPYFGGSHEAFLKGWSQVSRHRWKVLSLPARKWKWRMRHGAVTLADQADRLVSDGNQFDLLFCTDMLNLAEFKGLVSETIRRLPSVVYFHENQLTYPVRNHDQRDFHFALTNFTTALAATTAWFNSAFHRDSFLAAIPDLLRKMPDYRSLDRVEDIRNKAEVRTPGIRRLPPRPDRHNSDPARILWAARWEYDKNPEMFFDALRRLSKRKCRFIMNVVGQRFSRVPEIFEDSRHALSDHVGQWGYQSDRSEYERTLLESDIVVSTADHEFFGIAVLEAVAAGAYPLVPRRLAYPEILSPIRFHDPEEFFYDGSLADLEARLHSLIERHEQGRLWGDNPCRGVEAVRDYWWEKTGPRLDDALDRVAGKR